MSEGFFSRGFRGRREPSDTSARIPPGWTGYSRRIDTEMLREVAWSTDQRPQRFICSATPFVENAAASLVTLEYDPARIKTERFGPTGET
jgi:ferredoxin-NADP reductase